MKVPHPTRVLIGSPVHQKPSILKEFLQSLESLEEETLEKTYLLIDDNEDENSKELLRQFSERNHHATIIPSQLEGSYCCDEQTHHWNEQLIWKVARFKNEIIKEALQQGYDYLFLVDSDLVLHPMTLDHLLTIGEDIISEVFWTRWSAELPLLPQVWVSDQYTLYASDRNEILSDEKLFVRHMHFLNTLRRPGIYKVGGLGACTLISRRALEAGVNFKEIKNLSLTGEDRHFCIRAAVLGFPLYVDTHLPVYHIYRDKDLEGVSKYREIVRYPNVHNLERIDLTSYQGKDKES